MSELFSDRELEALVDRLLLEQGRLDPLELLLAADLLAYADYEAWRMGREADLQGTLRAAPAQATKLLRRAGDYARAQRLVGIALAHRGWGGLDEPLRIGADAELTRACATAFAPAADRPQLDLFHDSSAVALEEEICHALAERRSDPAREKVARLMREQPRHRLLHGFLRLIQAIDDSGDARPQERLRELLEIEPLARDLLGHRARDFLAPLWTGLAESVRGRAFDPASPSLHCSFAWARAGRWEAVCEAVEAEPDWHAQPLLVLTHAEACWRRGDAGAARRDWLSLCWEHPAQAERAFASRGFPDHRLAELWNGFGDLDPPLPTDDFPAWLLLQEPVLVAALPFESAPRDEQGAAYRLLHRLVNGGDDIELRRELGEIHPALLGLFLERRR